MVKIRLQPHTEKYRKFGRKRSNYQKKLFFGRKEKFISQKKQKQKKRLGINVFFFFTKQIRRNSQMLKKKKNYIRRFWSIMHFIDLKQFCTKGNKNWRLGRLAPPLNSVKGVKSKKIFRSELDNLF